MDRALVRIRIPLGRLTLEALPGAVARIHEVAEACKAPADAGLEIRPDEFAAPNYTTSPEPRALDAWIFWEIPSADEAREVIANAARVEASGRVQEPGPGL